MSREQKALVQNAGRRRHTHGNLPMCRLASVVRSAGGVLRFEAAGPLSLASAPWHAAQNCWYISWPEGIGEVAAHGWAGADNVSVSHFLG